MYNGLAMHSFQWKEALAEPKPSQSRTSWTSWTASSAVPNPRIAPLWPLRFWCLTWTNMTVRWCLKFWKPKIPKSVKISQIISIYHHVHTFVKQKTHSSLDENSHLNSKIPELLCSCGFWDATPCEPQPGITALRNWWLPLDVSKNGDAPSYGWFVYFMENPMNQCMITRGASLRKPPGSIQRWIFRGSCWIPKFQTAFSVSPL